MWHTNASPMAVAPGGSAFSAGYSGDYQGGGASENSELNWTAAILAVGFMAAFVGGCFAIESEKGQSACFSVLDAFLN